jgi:hypothetical protein
VAAGLVLLLLVGSVAWRAGNGADGGGERTGLAEAPSEARARRAEQTLTALAAAWAARDQSAFLDAAGDMPQAGAWAGRTYDALELLGVTDVELRFVGERVPRSPGPERTFAGDVEVSWELEGYRTATTTVTLSFGDTGSAVSVLGLAAGAGSVVTEGGPLPLWLAGELVGSPGARCLGLDTDSGSIGCERLARVAETDLAAVLPAGSRDGDWWVVLPGTAALSSALLGRGPAGLGNVAAVTTTLDASGSAEAPQVVVLNPEVMRALRPDARQLVLSHEATHAATGAAAVDLPLWVAEGFADYVALRAGRVPVERAASQVLASVRQAGPPRRLPSDEDFSGDRAGLGQTYEAAWLVFRLLGDRYGDDAVVAFYEEVLAGSPVERALEEHVGLSRAELTAAWQSDLTELAG